MESNEAKSAKLISIVIRTLNEATYLDQLLSGARKQVLPAGWALELVLIDSGSSDDTLAIADRHGCRITHISKAEFSFGRSLNRGCEFARGQQLVFISGHCLPVNDQWLARLTQPLRDGVASYSYGRQLGSGTTKFSERRVFLKYFPPVSLTPQPGFFVNNANSAITRDAWLKYRFDEALTGLEDMELGKRLVHDGGTIAYVAEAPVYHIHDESWAQVRNRYEREGMALAKIMPEAGMNLFEFAECTLRSVAKDAYAALREQTLLKHLRTIISFRTMQYWGSYRGTRLARSLARASRRSYFYPDQHFEKPDSD